MSPDHREERRIAVSVLKKLAQDTNVAQPVRLQAARELLDNIRQEESAKKYTVYSYGSLDSEEGAE